MQPEIEIDGDEVTINSLIIENSELVIEEIKGVIFCNDCKKESAVVDSCMIFCNLCDSSNINIIKGKDFVIKKIEE